MAGSSSLRLQARRRVYISGKKGGQRWGATRDPDTIRSYWRKWPNANIGIPCGDNGFWVADIDTQEGHGKDGPSSMAALVAQYGPLPTTLQASTPSGGIHHYWLWPPGVEKITTTDSLIAPGVDQRASNNGMVLAPPSLKNGVPYRWLNDAPMVLDPSGWSSWPLPISRACGSSAPLLCL